MLSQEAVPQDKAVLEGEICTSLIKSNQFHFKSSLISPSRECNILNNKIDCSGIKAISFSKKKKKKLRAKIYICKLKDTFYALEKNITEQLLDFRDKKEYF